MQTLEVNSIRGLPLAAKQILGAFPGKKIFAFYGQMGAGKTTLIKEICARLGVTENTSSPTFAIVNEYHSKQGEALFHFDFYRIEKLAEAYDIGFEEYLSCGSYCFIEWPDKVEGLLPGDCVKLKLGVQDGGKRIIELLTY